ncbi:hypothetical protein [Pseudacidovorax intermedius]|uniref:hypothetical protein n=1 Tax=Pseudacidovorax intermedius TaxID=433924 RepID=UPI00128FC781|nr:hypothetical protein [Pseudacidovorax intermedius]
MTEPDAAPAPLPSPSARPAHAGADADSPDALRHRFGAAAAQFGKLDTRPLGERDRPRPWWIRWLGLR